MALLLSLEDLLLGQTASVEYVHIFDVIRGLVQSHRVELFFPGFYGLLAVPRKRDLKAGVQNV